MEKFLTLNRLSVGYPGRTVLQNIDLSVDRGEILSVIGPNGAGKSTLLKSISGQLPLLGGSVVMQGEDLSRLPAAERARRIAVVLTEHIRPQYMTCREVVCAGRYPYTGRMGILRPEDEDAVDRAMERLKVTDLSARDFNAISDGQKQRVLVARAVAQETPLLILDEPTSYLDIRYRAELMEILRGLSREGRTILMSMHEIETALDVSDRLLCVEESGGVFSGKADELLAQDRIRDLFGMPEEMYQKVFGEKKRRAMLSAEDSATRGLADRDNAGFDHAFYTNRSCKYFPCHRGADPDSFNCLFCYCPLYFLGENCGGNFRYTQKGIKDCTGCLVPHRRENYARILEKLREHGRAGQREPSRSLPKGTAGQAASGRSRAQEPSDRQADADETCLREFISRVTGPSEELGRQVREDIDNLAMPPGSLGKIEKAAVRMAAIQGRRRPRAEKRRIIVLCADNGVWEEKVASAPQEVTARQACNMTKGLTGMSAIAAHRGDEVRVVDVGIATPYVCPEVLDLKVRKGTGNIVKGPAMSREEAVRAILTGIGLARQAFRDRVDIVGVGEMGIGNTTTSAAVISVLTGRRPEEVTGYGGGITEEAFARKVKCVEKAIEINRPDPDDPVDLLAKVGGLDIAAMCGVFLGCAGCRIPVVIDGVISAAAALCAVRLCPACRPYLFPSHESVEPGYRAAMKALSMEPWLRLEMRLGEGSGCTIAFAVMEAACAVLERMATFDKAGIDDGYLEEIRKKEVEKRHDTLQAD